ncbi:MAG TPA: hypothetical protein VM140_06340 [Burkholderiales bacterium]|nr:hypothetical protein [Burkholderiales bacterium]
MRASELVFYLIERKATELRLDVGKPPILAGPDGERVLEIPKFNRAAMMEILQQWLSDEKEVFERYKTEGSCDIEREFIFYRRSGKHYRIVATPESARFIWKS